MISSTKSLRNNYILIVFDSCRYDSFVRARPRTIQKLGKVQKRWSYASWTSPSHYNLLIGLMPHTSPKHVYASEYYKKDFLKFNERLGCDDFEFKSLIPKMFLPAFLQDTLGYRTNAMVSLPVLNPKTILNNGFDTLPADGQAQRHARHGQRDDVLRGAAVVLPVERGRDPLSLRPAGRAAGSMAAHQRRARRFQASGR